MEEWVRVQTPPGQKLILISIPNIPSSQPIYSFFLLPSTSASTLDLPESEARVSLRVTLCTVLLCLTAYATSLGRREAISVSTALVAALGRVARPCQTLSSLKSPDVYMDMLSAFPASPNAVPPHSNCCPRTLSP